MPFGKDYEKMVLIEIKHCIDRAEYKVVFIALMILNIASYILCVKNDIGKVINLFVQQMKISYYRALKRHIFHI